MGIREMRKEQGKTLQQLSAESGIASEMLGYMEKGWLRGSDAQLEKLAEVLGVSESELGVVALEDQHVLTEKDVMGSLPVMMGGGRTRWQIASMYLEIAKGIRERYVEYGGMVTEPRRSQDDGGKIM